MPACSTLPGCKCLLLACARRPRLIYASIGDNRYIIPTSVMASLDFYTDFNPWYQASRAGDGCQPCAGA